MMVKDDLRRILADRRIFDAAPEDIADDTELALDSLAVAWLLHRLHEEYGVCLDEMDDVIENFTSIDRIHSYLTRHLQEQR